MKLDNSTLRSKKLQSDEFFLTLDRFNRNSDAKGPFPPRDLGGQIIDNKRPR